MMRKGCFILFVVVAVWLSAVSTNAQSYAGLIDNTRASAGTGGLGTNGWATAGVQGGIPSALYSQCGSTIATGATPAAIQAALTACSASQFVLLGPGTFNFASNTGLLIRSNKVLRGSGADQTFIVGAAGAGNSIGCQISALFCIQGTSAGDFVPAAGINWTAGYAQGSNQITLASVTGISAGSMLLLDQCEDGMSGSPCTPVPPTTEIDNGNFFDCAFVYTTGTPNYGCGVNGDDTGNQRAHRPQTEVFLVTSVAGNVVTLNGTLRHPNWALSLTPQAVLLGPPATNSGIENLSIDMSAQGSNANAAVMGFDVANVWVKGVRVVKDGYAAFRFYEATHFTVTDSYVYGTTRSPGTDSDVVVVTGTSDCLIQNNIAQYLQVFYLAEGGDTGCVIGYNFMVNNYTGNNNGIYEAIFPHARDSYELYEGNIIDAYYGEDFHGPKLMNTLFRNAIWGWESGANLPTPVVKNSATQSVRNVAYSRYHNIIGNVFGTPGYHNAYQAGTQTSVISFGGGNTSSSGAVIPTDSVVASSSYPYGNYDVSNSGETRWCLNSSSTGWVAVCGSVSEVPTGFSPYGQPAPTVGDTGAGQTALPASLYLVPSPKPSWFGSLPFPLIGPDVTGGNVGQCSGTLNTVGQMAGVAATSNAQCPGTSLTTPAWGGHVNTNPAMNCFLNVMNGPADGSNTSALTFNAAACFSPSAPPPPPAVCTTCMVAVPLPAAPPIPILTLSSPAQTYVSSNGFSQDGLTWKPSLSLTLTGTGFTAATTCTFSGTAVPCVCGSSTNCTATVPASLVPIPTKPTQYPPIVLANPAIPLPVLQ